MPSKSQSQQAATAIALHNPSKLHAKNRGLLKMSREQLHDFASTPTRNLPQRKSVAFSRIGAAAK